MFLLYQPNNSHGYTSIVHFYPPDPTSYCETDYAWRHLLVRSNIYHHMPEVQWLTYCGLRFTHEPYHAIYRLSLSYTGIINQFINNCLLFDDHPCTECVTSRLLIAENRFCNISI